ncbi:hypothetical protein [Kingella oralis]|uniref:Uncharacterized protein n=1 Tax=Kingella oralis ATCC 51147 TaxID=629741 RepID=C4GFJ4_9NEIS|nr:hypothetical protein [Kingella oralis]EEP68999.1 hypothetical protein GCWU000324_00910 [Kingella oralis ATCC 51147]QMT41854.1 hypothetical protein H3L93_07285 [Kingella oralis]
MARGQFSGCITIVSAFSRRAQNHFSGCLKAAQVLRQPENAALHAKLA